MQLIFVRRVAVCVVCPQFYIFNFSKTIHETLFQNLSEQKMLMFDRKYMPFAQYIDDVFKSVRGDLLGL